MRHVTEAEIQACMRETGFDYLQARGHLLQRIAVKRSAEAAQQRRLDDSLRKMFQKPIA